MQSLQRFLKGAFLVQPLFEEADDALARINAVNTFLKQGLDEKSTFEETLQALHKVVA